LRYIRNLLETLDKNPRRTSQRQIERNLRKKTK
jgi:hypothetical protein